MGSKKTELIDESLLSDGFNAAEYVNRFLQGAATGEEVRKLQALRSQLNATSNAAAEQVKDIVFDNYKQFIDTSKEISLLEREIYELSSSLTEQKGLIESMMEMCGQEKRSSCSVSIHSSGNVHQSPLQSLIHRVEGIADVLNNLKSNEKILLMSEMTLLDENTMNPVQPIFLVLLSETFIIGRPSEPGSKLRFQLESYNRLDNVALVNVKRVSTEHQYAELIIQLIIFPHQLYIKCESARMKRQWLDGVEGAKRQVEQEKSLHRQATIRAKRRKNSATPHPKDPRMRLQQYAQSRPESTIRETEDNESDETSQKAEDLEWLRGLVDEIQDVISHHHADEAIDLLTEYKQASCSDPELIAQFNELEKRLVRMLSDELKQPLHGGSRAVSRPLSLLRVLGRSNYGMDLYLRRQSASLSSQARELEIENPLAYVRKVSELFANDIMEGLKDPNIRPSDRCLVLQWSCSEIFLLLSLIRRHVIEVQGTSMGVLTRTWSILSNECHRLADAGLDVSFEVHRLLIPSLRTYLENCFATTLQSVRLRVQEERWKPYNLESEANLKRFVEELSDIKATDDDSKHLRLTEIYLGSAPHCLNLSSSGCEFARMAFNLSRDLSFLDESAEIRDLTDSFVITLWSEYLQSLSDAPPNEVQTLTCRFILSELIPLCDFEYDSNDLIQALLNRRFPQLKSHQRRPSEFIVVNDDDDDSEGRV